VNALRSAEHEVLRLKDHMPAESPDPVVIARAQELGAILLSLNGDFADLVAYPPRQLGGIVALQIRDLPEITPAVLQWLLMYAAAHPRQQDYRGKLLLIEAHRLRVRE
jgi:predicted nuclease of predicted toxin-antitoxin system